MTKPVILTGLRANNDLHIGNYLGALLPLVDTAREKSKQYQINIFVPDLHSFTTPIDHSRLQQQIFNNLKLYIAAGLPLNGDNIHIYRQSYISAHSELTWILDCFTSMGELGRMTQFKDKAKKTKETILNESPLVKVLSEFHSNEDSTVSNNNIINFSRGWDQSFIESKELIDILIDIDQKGLANKFTKLFIEIKKSHTRDLKEFISLYQELNDMSIGAYGSVGLFNYPVLMAADILLYNATYVPVGEDQTQHLEFARDIAERMNRRFGELFVVPKPVKDQHAFFGKDHGLRIKDLTEPTKKMSKSNETGKGVIYLNDSPESARKKIMSATTDSLGNISYDPTAQPGIANLLTILALFSGKTLEEIRDTYEGQKQYGPLKSAVADAVVGFLKDFQDRLSAVNEAHILEKLESDEKLMNKQAGETLYKVQKAVGLRK